MINLNTEDLISSAEASLLWGKQKDYVRTVFNKYPARFPEGTIRKFGKQLIVTREGMEAVTKHKRLSQVLLKQPAGQYGMEEATVIGVEKYKILIRFENGEVLKVKSNEIIRID
jgi:hypothetical protein